MHTRDERSIRGVLIACYRRELVLAHAAYLVEGERSTAQPLEGEVCIPRENIAFIQRVGARGGGAE